MKNGPIVIYETREADTMTWKAKYSIKLGPVLKTMTDELGGSPSDNGVNLKQIVDDLMMNRARFGVKQLQTGHHLILEFLF